MNETNQQYWLEYVFDGLLRKESMKAERRIARGVKVRYWDG